MHLIDHIVHAVHSVDEAAASYRALGFLVTPRAIHPWGTINRLVLVEDSYIELLEVPTDLALPEPGPGEFGFAYRARRFLGGGAGLAMIVIATDDAAADHARFAAAGIGGYDRLDFRRQATQPNGAIAQVAFSLAFADTPVGARSFFACKQHTPDLIWNPHAMSHPNGATRLESIVIGHDADLAFFDAFTGLQPAGRTYERAGQRLIVDLDAAPRDAELRFIGATGPTTDGLHGLTLTLT